jgi:hypothetical protein
LVQKTKLATFKPVNNKNKLLKNLTLCSLVAISVLSCKSLPQSNTYYETDYAGNPVARSGLALPQANENYPIDVIFKPDKPKHQVIDIEEISIGNEQLNGSKEQIVQGRMVGRGQNADIKKILIANLIDHAVQLGAHCLYNVNYQYYTDQTSSGYILSGMAAKYDIQTKKIDN